MQLPKNWVVRRAPRPRFLTEAALDVTSRAIYGPAPAGYQAVGGGLSFSPANATVMGMNEVADIGGIPRVVTVLQQP